MLKNHKGRVTVKIDGIAASAASVVAMAGDETLITPTGMLMIHNPMTFASGNKSDMEKAIKILEEVKESIINAYVLKTGLSRNKISKLMDEETWMNAEKALQLGFVDGILFDEKKSLPIPEEEPDEEEPEKETPDEGKSEEDEPEEDSSKKKNIAKAMQYSPAATTASLMQKISALSPVKGVPIDQLDKRLALLNH